MFSTSNFDSDTLDLDISLEEVFDKTATDNEAKTIKLKENKHSLCFKDLCSPPKL